MGLLEIIGITEKKNKSVYCLMTAIIKNIGGDGYTGNKSPMNMLVETFADINKLSNNHTNKTISVGIKDRGSILMGGIHADAAYWYYGKEKAQWV